MSRNATPRPPHGTPTGKTLFPRLATPLLALAVCALWLAWPQEALAGAADASGWRLDLSTYPGAPRRFVAVHKDGQELYLFERHSPLAVASKLPCTTGQQPGDKFAEGDLRTPEGVYFIERRRTDNLDFDLYGTQAFVLNFPNPVDRIKGKGGSGIWVHGRGHEVTPRETRGCVALNDPDLIVLSDSLEVGMPVSIARELSWRPEENPDLSAEAAELLERVEGWAQAWRSKSSEFLSYYDAGKFAMAQETSFEAFASHKKRLFADLEWIELMLADVALVRGPDYWVSYFGQYYRTSSLASQGVKRLYWQRGADGVFRIVGKEWHRGHKGLEKAYALDAEARAKDFVKAWREAWLDADLERYLGFYANDAVQGDNQGLDAVAAHKRELWRAAPPARVETKKLRVALHPEGFEVSFIQEYDAANGYGDRGEKTLVLTPRPRYDGGQAGFAILREDWRAL